MRVKVSELSGAQLDYWVAKSENVQNIVCFNRVDGGPRGRGNLPYYSSDWALGGTIIERENIQLTPPTSHVHRNGGPQSGWGQSGVWSAVIWERGANGHRPWAYHETSPLIAAMRCYVVSKFGEYMEIE